MDDQVKKELIARGVPALGVPLLRMVVDNHYEMKRIDRKEEMAVKVAQQRSEGLQSTFGRSAAPTQTRSTSGDVYQDIHDLREEVSCSFCSSILSNLMEAPPEEAEEGYYEMAQYVDAMEQTEGGLSEDEIGGIVESWETIPQYAEM